MQNVSITQTANYAAMAGMIVMVLNFFGVDIAEEQVVIVIAGLTTLVGIGVSIYRKYQTGTVTLSAKKKK